MTWGQGAHGQLGHGLPDVLPVPTLVEALEGIPVRQAAAGGWHTAVVTGEGDLYTFGRDNHRQLGRETLGDGHVSQYLPSCVDLPPGALGADDHSPGAEVAAVAHVACGSAHTVALCRDGSVFGWGWNAHGQVSQQSPTIRSHPEQALIAPGEPTLLDVDSPLRLFEASRHTSEQVVSVHSGPTCWFTVALVASP